MCGSRVRPCRSGSRARAARPGTSSLKDRRVARIVKACQDLPGQELFQYIDADGDAARRHLLGRQRVPARDRRRGLHRQGFPHLGRHGAGGAGAARVRDLRQRGGGQAQRPRGDRERRRPPRQHADDLPQVLHPPADARLLSGGRPAPAGEGCGRDGAERGSLPASAPRRRRCSACCRRGCAAAEDRRPGAGQAGQARREARVGARHGKPQTAEASAKTAVRRPSRLPRRSRRRRRPGRAPQRVGAA